MLSATYGEAFYRGTNEEDVVMTWATQFANDDPKEVMKGVQNCINTMRFRPTIADIRERMAKSRMKGQKTATEAFQEIYKAVNSCYDKESAGQAFNSLSPICRKLVGTPSILISWSRVPDETFMTVIMSAIRESYKELAEQELDYNALPEHLKRNEDWMVDAPSQVALPEPKIEKTYEERMHDMDEDAKRYREEHGMQMTEELQMKHASRIADFKKPLSDKDLKRMEMTEQRKFEYMKNDKR